MVAQWGDASVQEASAEPTVSVEQLFKKQVLWEDAFKERTHEIGRWKSRAIPRE